MEIEHAPRAGTTPEHRLPWPVLRSAALRDVFGDGGFLTQKKELLVILLTQAGCFPSPISWAWNHSVLYDGNRTPSPVCGS